MAWEREWWRRLGGILREVGHIRSKGRDGEGMRKVGRGEVGEGVRERGVEEKGAWRRKGMNRNRSGRRGRV